MRMNNDSSTFADPFASLGLPRRFDVDPEALRAAWLAGTARLHPDRPGAPHDAAHQLAALNDAKATIEDPERRANALLSLLGGATKEQDKSLPTGFLSEMLEARERMESEIAAEGDAARSRWEAWSATRRNAYIERVAELFARPSDSGVLRAIRMELNAWRYIERLIEQVESSLSDV